MGSGIPVPGPPPPLAPSALPRVPGSKFQVRFGIWDLGFPLTPVSGQRFPFSRISLSISLISRGAVWLSTW